MISGSTIGSLLAPESVPPLRTSVVYGPCDVRNVTWSPSGTTVLDHLLPLTRLLAPGPGVMLAVKVPSSIWSTHYPSAT